MKKSGDVNRVARRPFLPEFENEILRIGGQHFPSAVMGRERLEHRLRRWETGGEPRVCLAVHQGAKEPPHDCKCSGCLDALAFVYFDSINQQFGNGGEYLRIQSDKQARIIYEAAFAEGRRSI